MKLVEILAQEMEEWPETTYCYTQDSNGNAYPWREAPTFSGKSWLGGDVDMSDTAFLFSVELASDYRTAIVDKGMWLGEKNKLHEGVNTEWREGVDTKRQERENYIDRIYSVMCKAERPNNRSDMAEALYDAGLRFVEE